MQLFNKYYASKTSYEIDPCNSPTIKFIDKGCNNYICIFSCSKYTLIGTATLLNSSNELIINVNIDFDKPVIGKLTLNADATRGNLYLYQACKSAIIYYVNYIPTYLN